MAIPPDLNFQYGDFIRFSSSLKEIRNFQNPGGFDYKRLMNLQGIYVSGYINDSSEIMLIRKNTASDIRLKLESFRTYLKHIIYKNSSSPQREVLEAITIGNQNEIPADIRDSFSKTGTSHILSISGLHIGMVAAAAFFFSFLILKSSEYLMLRFNIIKIAALAAFLMVFIYAFIAGMGITVMRATLMAFIFLLALLSGKQNHHYNTLAIAALIILVISPEALFDISFQLSFMAVLSIIYIVPKFSDFPVNKISFLPSWIPAIIRYLYITIIICVAATIGTLPLIMYYFQSISSVTIIANIIAVPLLGTLTLAVSMFFIFFAFFSPTIAGFFVKMASCLTQLSINIINKLAAFPFSSLKSIKPCIFEIALFYLFIFLFIQFIDERRKRNANNDFSPFRLNVFKYLLIIIVLFFVADTTYFKLTNDLSSDLKITILDVGQGNSIFVQFPGGKNMIIDGGGFSESSFDTGKAVVAPFLYYKRISKVDTAVLSHPHPDHLLGLIYILDNFSVRQILKSGLPVNPETYPQWERAIRDNKINVSLISAESPEEIFNGVHLKVLWPTAHCLKDAENIAYKEFNNYSLVLKITYGKISILIPGDISGDIEKKLIKSGADLKSDVLVVPHHGSIHSSTTEFIKAVACRYAIVSAGKSNVFKHPHPSVLQRYKEAGMNIYRTDKNGAISIKTDGNNLEIDSFVKDI